MKSLNSVILLSVSAVVLAIASHSLAQQRGRDYPIVGTWALNLQESTFAKDGPNYPAAQQQTEVYEVLDSGFMQLTLSRITADGTSTPYKLSWPASGGVVRFAQGTVPAGQALIETRVAPGEWFVTYMDDGAQFMTMHKVVSTDGQKMRQTLAMYVDGERRETVQVLDRE